MRLRRQQPDAQQVAARHDATSNASPSLPIDPSSDQSPRQFSPQDADVNPHVFRPQTARVRRSIEQVLVERDSLSSEQVLALRDALTRAAGKPIASVITAANIVPEPRVYAALAESMGLAFLSPDPSTLDASLLETIGSDYARDQLVLPISTDSGVLTVAVADPANVFLLDEIARKTGKSLRTLVATPTDILRAIDHLTAADAGSAVDDIIKDIADDDVQLVKESRESEVNDLEKAGNESPVIKFVNYLIQDAMRQGASDIHIEPREKQLRVRYRIDGVLFEAMTPPHTMHAAVTSRLKIMANLDISERRLPQDGRIRAMVQGRQVDLRMSTLPTAFGEKTCIRILDNKSISVPLEALGFSEAALTIWRRQIDQPHGILLVTGPTGSGKTTTLYSSLRVMDGNEMNISTVEDPIEYTLASANQVQVHDKIGMTFSAALRSLLRQDPDVVMLGEIRDGETARIAVQAALTGHLVLSTLHTNDAPSSVTRLINIGVEPYLISAALNAVLAQRLVRKLCPHCRQLAAPSDSMRDFLTIQGFNESEIWASKGCDKCRKTGFAGRLGIYELMVMDDALRDMVTQNPDVNNLRKYCRERGLIALREDGFEKARAGLTTIDEVLRVTESSL